MSRTPESCFENHESMAWRFIPCADKAANQKHSAYFRNVVTTKYVVVQHNDSGLACWLHQDNEYTIIL